MCVCVCVREREREREGGREGDREGGRETGREGGRTRLERDREKERKGEGEGEGDTSSLLESHTRERVHPRLITIASSRHNDNEIWHNFFLWTRNLHNFLSSQEYK